jgi:rhodanese-related sulfurtransferase
MKGTTVANKITLKELQEKIEVGSVTIVEALGSMYYEKEHIPGAINIPLEEVDDLAPKMLPDKAADIVVYCASGPCQDSPRTADRLTALGYTNVTDYHEGKQEWIEEGLPLETGLQPARS